MYVSGFDGGRVSLDSIIFLHPIIWVSLLTPDD